MSLSLKEDKDSDIKSWLNQAEEGIDDAIKHQPRITMRSIQNPVLPKVNLTSPMRKKSVSKSPQRKPQQNFTTLIPPPGFSNYNSKGGFEKTHVKPESQAFMPSSFVQQPVQIVQTSLPKLKISEFHGDPLEWPEWSSLFTATIHNAPIDDNAKMSHLKTLVKGKAKAAIAGLGFSGTMYNTAWNALVSHFGRPQTIVNAQMKQIHTSPFIKSHDSTAIIK